jgi:hypothetical protein
MKHKIILVLVTAVLIGLAVPAPVTAYSGMSGGVIDSRNLDPWLNGADIWIVNNTQGGAIVATGTLNTADGTFNLAWGQDDLNYFANGGIPLLFPPASGDQVELIIDFSCGYSSIYGANPATCPPLNGTPTTMSFSITQNAIPIRYNLGTNNETGTGPTSVQLVDFSVSQPAPQNTWLPYVLLIGSVILVSGAVTILRKRRVS